MKRTIIYPGAIPQDTDLLSTNQNTMVALGFLAQAALGTGTLADGLACTATTPASLAVLVGPGSIYSVQSLEATAYGSLGSDTTDSIVKQGIMLGNTTFNTPAPATSGQSVVYLVQAEYQDVDGGSTVLPYYNAANPAVPYSGPANSGTAQNTVRDGKCVLALKTGTAAATGTQVMPTPDAGYVGLWAITVANGQSTVTSGNIAQLPAAFIGNKLTSKVGAINRQVFAANGTYTPSAGLLYAFVEVQAPGGGGGAIPSTSGTQGAAGAGGSAGGYASKWIQAATIGASQAVSVGGAGAGGAPGANSGANAGNASFGSILAANGGGGGGTTGAVGGISGTSSPAAGGTASGGDVNISGGGGSFGIAFGGSTFGIGGAGGNSRLGIGGIGGLTLAGANGAGYGSGGGGAGNGSDYNPRSGGNGAAGAVIVTEYCA